MKRCTRAVQLFAYRTAKVEKSLKAEAVRAPRVIERSETEETRLIKIINKLDKPTRSHLYYRVA